MSLDTFIEIYQDLPILEKVHKLIETMDIKCSDTASWVNASRNRNAEEAEYWSNEIKAMNARIEWLYREIRRELEGGTK